MERLADLLPVVPASGEWIEMLAAKSEAPFVDHVDVVWTATDPKRKGRWAVAWYRDDRMYRNRVTFPKLPATQHRLES